MFKANNFTVNYNNKGADRKAMVNAISEITGAEKKYLGVPSCAYQIGCFTVNKAGNLVFDEQTNTEELEHLVEELAKRGFEAEEEKGEVKTEEETAAASEPEQEPEAEPEPEEEDEEDEELEETEDGEMKFTVGLPKEKLDDEALERVKAIVAGKASLIKKALGAESLEIKVKKDRIEFPWFTISKDGDEAEEAKAFTTFTLAICKLAREAKRVNAREDKEVPNEKYAFRCFLLRLGFIGTEYKKQRKVLLKNLEGSSAFRSGAKKDAVSEQGED